MTTRGGIVAAIAAIVMLAAVPVQAAGPILTQEMVDQIRPGMTTQEVEQILGPPANRSKFPRMNLISMDYVLRAWNQTYDIGVMIKEDGTVKEVQRVVRYKGAG